MKNEMYPCLWYDGQAREAAEFYCGIFPNSKIIHDSGIVVNFQLDGRFFMALNGGDTYKFTEAVSFVIPCIGQAEIDHYWNKLTADGGKEQVGGWCKDKFGLSWQVIPSDLGNFLSDPERGQRAMDAFLKMKKVDIETLRNA